MMSFVLTRTTLRMIPTLRLKTTVDKIVMKPYDDWEVIEVNNVTYYKLKIVGIDVVNEVKSQSGELIKCKVRILPTQFAV